MCLPAARSPESADDAATERRPLWPDGAAGVTQRDPTYSLFAAPEARATGAAVVVLPGGAYAGHAPHEAEPVARWLNEIGITAIVLYYRVGPSHRHPAMMKDASRGIRLLRANAKEWGLDAGRIGVLGFSAGGHLASTILTHFDEGDVASSDPVARVRSRPDFGVLIYPVITMVGRYSHAGSRENLVGEAPPPGLVALLSNERQVTTRTPRVFLVHGSDDAGVPVENSLMFASALRQAGVPFELHVFQNGAHGFGLGEDDPVLGTWPGLCESWMRRSGLLGERAPRQTG